MEKQKLMNELTDFQDTTEYFYEELGKFFKTADLIKKKRDRKWLYNSIMKNFKSTLNNVTFNTKSNASIDKIRIKQFDSEFKNLLFNSKELPCSNIIEANESPLKSFFKNLFSKKEKSLENTTPALLENSNEPDGSNLPLLKAFKKLKLNFVAMRKNPDILTF